MRIILLVSAVAALAAVAVGAAAAAHPAASVVASAPCPTVTSGQLTAGTDNPAYDPWFSGGTPTSKWKINDPSNGKGHESAVAYAIAKQLGYGMDNLKWIYVLFNKSFAPGPKSFDFDRASLPSRSALSSV